MSRTCDIHPREEPSEAPQEKGLMEAFAMLAFCNCNIGTLSVLMIVQIIGLGIVIPMMALLIVKAALSNRISRPPAYQP